MFAVIETGGKQYKVSKNSIIKIEKIEGESGQSIEFTKVLMAKNSDSDTVVGAPFVKDAVVKAEILNQVRAPKIIVFKKKRRQNYRRKAGHRQHLTHIKILDLVGLWLYKCIVKLQYKMRSIASDFAVLFGVFIVVKQCVVF